MSILLAIDAGHGSNTAGKRTPDGYREHWINVKTAYACEQYILKNTNYIRVLRVAWDDTNSKDDDDVSLSQRQAIIESAGCDLSVSFHANASGDGKTYNTGRGVETLIHNNDSYQRDSLRLAEYIQAELIKGTEQKNRGVKEMALAMCNCPKMGVDAAALVEIGFMTNKIEADLMMGEAFCREQGEEVARGIIEYCKKKYPISATTSSPVTENKESVTPTELYRVRLSWDDAASQKGAYADLENAKETCDKNEGYTVYNSKGTAVYGAEANKARVLYRVRKTWDDANSQIGAFSDLENAKAACDDGYTVFDNNGIAVYGELLNVNTLYRVRKSWEDAASQVGAYRDLTNAKETCDKNAGYTVYDENGKAIYGAETDENQMYRVRLSWDDAGSQKGAYRDLTNAKEECDKHVGYHVFNNAGVEVYTSKKKAAETVESNKEEVKKEEPETVYAIISPLHKVSHQTLIEYIGTRANKDMETSGILASVTTAQAILESGWGQSDLSLYANNLFGMKTTLSGNTWDSVWDGKNKYTKYSPEEYNGVVTQVQSDFRAYASVELSIADHSAYLNGAMKGKNLRYEGLKGETDYRTAIQIIKDGGYATDSGYVDKICNIIEKYNLSEYDFLEEEIELDTSENIPKVPVEIIPDVGDKDEPVIEITTVVGKDESTDKEDEKVACDCSKEHEEIKESLDNISNTVNNTNNVVNTIASIVQKIFDLLSKIFK